MSYLQDPPVTGLHCGGTEGGPPMSFDAGGLLERVLADGPLLLKAIDDRLGSPSAGYYWYDRVADCVDSGRLEMVSCDDRQDHEHGHGYRCVVRVAGATR